MAPTVPWTLSKTQAFHIVVPTGNSPETIVDATASIVDLSEVYCVEHLRSLSFQVTVKSIASMTLIVNAASLVIGGDRCLVVPVGPQVTNVICLFLPPFVPNEFLVQALSPYGKVLAVNASFMSGRRGVLTGTRFVRMEMSTTTPVPNYLRISATTTGHSAPHRSLAVVAFTATKAKDTTVLVGVVGMVTRRLCALFGAHTQTLLLQLPSPYRRRQVQSLLRVTPRPKKLPRQRINQCQQMIRRKQAARAIATCSPASSSEKEDRAIDHVAYRDTPCSLAS
ncbi:hypothetical protein HPB49_011437 [Dermacentor silvarum]|uniref:Uncharacterized protein n=1 Tax=Dermacentor silvarum TaxID=543639 RepID=A0ACB8CX23_DERSI|nr:hypothetical protein HPB49_011437 [Dermacentor silvarum]